MIGMILHIILKPFDQLSFFFLYHFFEILRFMQIIICDISDVKNCNVKLENLHAFFSSLIFLKYFASSGGI
jgi:hypothetical protein